MKAIVLNQSTYKLETREVEKPVVGKDEVCIRIIAAAINHHELWTLTERDLKSESHIIMGSDGAGIIEEVGDAVKNFKVGDQVILNPSLHWGLNDRVQGQDYEILGFPTQGTFAEYLKIHEGYVYPMPAHLSFQESAALPLAGLTAYRALFTRGEIEPHETVLVTGIGGGAALYALQYAVALGADVFVTSGNNSKISRALELGAIGGTNYRNENWDAELRKMAKGFDVIIDSAAGKDFVKLTELANPGGRISMFGRTAGNIAYLDPKIIFWKQLSLHGTTMGTDHEFRKMIDFICSKNIKPVIDSVFSAKDAHLAFERMDKGGHFGKIIIDMQEF